MAKIKVWTRQHKNVLKELEAAGRYIARKEYIYIDMQEHADIIFEVYDWLVKNGPDAGKRPLDVKYPVWVSFDEGAAYVSKAEYVRRKYTESAPFFRLHMAGMSGRQKKLCQDQRGQSILTGHSKICTVLTARLNCMPPPWKPSVPPLFLQL